MANVVEFTIKGFDKATGPLSKVSKTLARTVKGITAAAAAATAAATGIFLLTDSVTKSQDAIAKMGQRLGIASDELSQFHFIALRGSVSTTNFNLAMQRMTRRVSEAAQGMGEAQTALKELNISAQFLNNLPLAQQMRFVANELAKVGSQADKVRLAFKLFDSEGVAAVLQTMDDLGPNFDKVIADFRFLGGEVVPQAAANAEVFQDELVRVKTAMFGLSQAISNRVLPIVNKLAENFANFVARNRNRIAAFIEGAISGFVRFFVTIRLVLRKIGSLFNEAFGSTEGFARVFVTFLENFAIILGGMVSLVIKSAPALLAAFVAVFKGVFEAFLFLGREAWIGFWDFAFGTDVALSFEQAIKFGLDKGINSALPVVRLALKDITSEIELKTVQISDAFSGTFDGIDAEVAVITASISENLNQLVEEVGSTTDTVSKRALDGITRTVEGGRLLIESLSKETAELLATLGTRWLEEQEMFREGLVLRKELLTQFHEEQFAALEEADAFLREKIISSIETITDALSIALLTGQSLSKALQSTFKALLTQVIGFLIKTGIQRLILSKLNIASTQAEGASQLAVSLAAVFTNSFASAAAIPVIGHAIAPGIAAANLATATAGATSAGVTGAALGATLGAGPVALHAGLEFVPRETTYLLNRGERVLSPEQNKDLTQFISNIGQSGNADTRPVSIESLVIEVLPNATSLDVLREITVEELREEFVFKMIEALDDVDRLGVRPKFAERNRGT